MLNRLPPKICRQSGRAAGLRECAAHRAWVRLHHCSVPGCSNLKIECAHVRAGTDGGQGLKPSDRWCLSLCSDHHAEQHRIGEIAFARRYGIDLKAIASAFASRSPHRDRLLVQGSKFLGRG